MNTIWTLGIDPGFGMSGLVLLRDSKNVEAWALHALSADECPVEWVRAMSLASGILDTITRWVEEFDIKHMEISIELPVYKQNPRTFTLQIRLLEELESGLTMWLHTLLDSLHITEVNPSTSKKLLTGNAKADKNDMIAASPWAGDANLNHVELHTLADAYAHALSASMRKVDVVNVGFAPWTLHKDNHHED